MRKVNVRVMGHLLFLFMIIECSRSVHSTIGFGCQKVAFKFLTVKLHKAVSVLFRCPKIRKAKHA